MALSITATEMTTMLQNLYEWQHGPLDAGSMNLIAGSTSYGQVQRAFADKTVADGLPTDITAETIVFRPDTNIQILYAYYTTLALNTVASDFDYANFFIYHRGGGITTLSSWKTKVANGSINIATPYYIGMNLSDTVPAGNVVTFEIGKAGLGVGVGVGRLEIYYRQV